jgi:hypothetical protein
MGRGHVSFASPNGKPHISNAPISEFPADVPTPGFAHCAREVASVLLPKRKGAMRRAVDAAAAVLQGKKADSHVRLQSAIAARALADKNFEKAKADAAKAREPIDHAHELDSIAKHARRAAHESRGDDLASVRLLEIEASDAEAAADC